jgi:hypothetical protein
MQFFISTSLCSSFGSMEEYFIWVDWLKEYSTLYDIISRFEEHDVTHERVFNMWDNEVQDIGYHQCLYIIVQNI